MDGEIRVFTLTPELVGLKRHNKEDLRGGDAAFNADALSAMLNGAPGAYRDTVLMNAGAGLIVAGKVDRLEDAVRAAAEAIDNRAAAQVLARLVEISNG